MYTFPLSILGLVLASLQCALAFVDVIIPSSITAEQDFQIQITNDLAAGNSSDDSHFGNFRVFLLIPIPGWSLETFGYYPTCLLAEEIPIDVTTINVRIPASVGPNAPNYQFALEEYRCDGLYCNNYIQESESFELTGGKGHWSEAELADHNLGPDFNGLSCTAYECERKCNRRFVPGNWSTTNTYEETQKCIKKCAEDTFREIPVRPFNYTGPGTSQSSFQNSTSGSNITVGLNSTLEQTSTPAQNSTLGQNSTSCQYGSSNTMVGIATKTAATARSSSFRFTNVTANTFSVPTPFVSKSSSTNASTASSPTLNSSSRAKLTSFTATPYVGLVTATTTTTTTISPATTTIMNTRPATLSSLAHRSFNVNPLHDSSKTTYITRATQLIGSYRTLFVLLTFILF